MSKTLIIGYGSPIRGDDAIGPLVADRLLHTQLPANIEVVARHILSAELVADLDQAERVIFLDASVEGNPGEVRCERLMPDAQNLSTMAHFLDPRELLAWCEALNGKTPEAWLICACGAVYDYAHYQLSEQAEQAARRMVRYVEDFVAGRRP